MPGRRSTRRSVHSPNVGALKETMMTYQATGKNWAGFVHQHYFDSRYGISAVVQCDHGPGFVVVYANDPARHYANVHRRIVDAIESTGANIVDTHTWAGEASMPGFEKSTMADYTEVWIVELGGVQEAFLALIVEGALYLEFTSQVKPAGGGV